MCFDVGLALPITAAVVAGLLVPALLEPLPHTCLVGEWSLDFGSKRCENGRRERR